MELVLLLFHALKMLYINIGYHEIIGNDLSLLLFFFFEMIIIVYLTKIIMFSKGSISNEEKTSIRENFSQLFNEENNLVCLYSLYFIFFSFYL